MQNTDANWSYPVNVSDKARAKTVIMDIARKIVDPGVLTTAISNSKEQSEYFSWHDSNNCDLAMLFGYLDEARPGLGFDHIAHRFLMLAVGKDLDIGTMNGALFGGLAGLGLTALKLSKNGARYQKLLSGIDLAVKSKLVSEAQYIKNAPNAMPQSAYDVVSGLAGRCAYLISRPTTHVDTLGPVLEALISLVNADGMLGAFRTPKALVEGYLRHGPLFPYGFINCGLAHGVPGVLASLSLAYQRGIRFPGHEEAIATIADWLLKFSVYDKHGINWSSMIAVDQIGNLVAPSKAAASAWCYGSPGVARSLWLAGSSLNRQDYRHVATEAVKSAVQRVKNQQERFGSHNLCHGTAGFLQVVARFYHDTNDPLLGEAVGQLFKELVDRFEPSSSLGYRDHSERDQPLDDPRFLSGIAGSVTVLVCAAYDLEPIWDRLLMLS